MTACRIVIAGLLAIMGTGCASHAHRLTPGAGPFIRGQFDHASQEKTVLVLETGSTRYEAAGFPVETHSDLQSLRSRYYATDRRHWERIVANLDPGHTLWSAEANPRSADGAQLLCRITWTATQAPAGFCADPNGSILDIFFDKEID